MQRIKQCPRLRIVALIVIMLGTGVMSAPQNVQAATYPCTDLGVGAALATGGSATFSCSAPTTVMLTGQMVTKNVTLDGVSLLTISESGTDQIFTVNSGVTFGVQNLTIANGRALSSGKGAGILNNGGAVIVVSSILYSNNSPYTGGGIYNLNGKVTVTNSTLYGNSSNGTGGAIYNYNGLVTVTNSTLSGNSALNGGGGIYNDGNGSVTVTDSTLSGNQSLNGGGIDNNIGTMSVTDTLIVNSTGGDVSGSLSTNSHNITGSFTFAGGLANNGGPTPTLALPPGSPAFDAGICNPTYTDPITNMIVTVTTDQRGITRPQGGGCDIGAYELIPNVAPRPMMHPNGSIIPMPPAPQPNPKMIITPTLQPPPNAQPMRH